MLDQVALLDFTQLIANEGRLCYCGLQTPTSSFKMQQPLKQSWPLAECFTEHFLCAIYTCYGKQRLLIMSYYNYALKCIRIWEVQGSNNCP
jgi:hypothetical protein